MIIKFIKEKVSLSRLLLFVFATLFGGASLNLRASAPGQREEFRTRLERLLTIARDNPQDLFAGAIRPEMYEARRKQLIDQAKAIRELAGKNNYEDIKRLAIQAHFAIQQAYNAVAPKLQQLSEEDTQKFKDFINLARQEPAAIFPDPAVRDALKTKLLNKVARLRSEAKEWLPQAKQLIADLELWINKAYDATAKGAKPELNPVVESVLEVAVGSEAPPMEVPPFDAPPLEEGSIKAPTVLDVSAESGKASKASKPALEGGREKFLEEIREGKRLKPVSQRKQPQNPASQQRPSMMEDLKRQMEERRKRLGAGN